MVQCRGVVSGVAWTSSKQWSRQYYTGAVGEASRGSRSSISYSDIARIQFSTVRSSLVSLSPFRFTSAVHAKTHSRALASTTRASSARDASQTETRDSSVSTVHISPKDTTATDSTYVMAGNGPDSNSGSSNDIVLSKEHATGMLKLFRDCLRLVQYIAPRGSSKHGALKQSIVSQFKSRAAERNADTIQRYQADAVRALSNYLLLTSITKKSTATGATTTNKRTAPSKADDAASSTTTSRDKVHAAMQDYHERSVQEARQEQKERKQVNPISTPTSTSTK
jgi:hypothetical protein